MTQILGALAPVFLLIVIGWAARASRLLSDETFAGVNRFGYFVPYPAFLFTTVAGADLYGTGAALFLATCITGFLLIAALALALRFAFRDGPAFTSVYQGALRWNGFVVLAAAEPLYGPRGDELIALAFGPLVLMVNIICVAVLARWGATRLVSKRAIAAQVLANPLIIACAVGLVFNAAQVHAIPVVTDGLRLIGQSAMPLALICVGAGLDFGPLRRGWTYVAASAGMKLLAAPLVMFAVARLYHLDPVTTAICVGIGSTSTAAASYTLAREMGGDARVMAGIVSATTLFSFLTMPIVIGLSGAPAP
ncbi:MAG: AEC family transporter [Alphaproteobacteria bacterium]|nr:AEC family transporter [Alphaproteobacteria bacterium]